MALGCHMVQIQREALKAIRHAPTIGTALDVAAHSSVSMFHHHCLCHRRRKSAFHCQVKLPSTATSLLVPIFCSASAVISGGLVGLDNVLTDSAYS